MKKTTRLAFIAVLALVVVACGSVLVACGGGNAKEAIEAYILDINTVEDDFILPKYIGELNKEGVGTVQVSWKSDNAAITIEERENDFLAKVTQGTSLTNVKLTISAKGNEKEFTVKVLAFDVYSLSGSYVFKQDRGTVGANFALDTEWKYKGHTATIEWSVPEDYANNLAISEDGKTALVTVSKGEEVPVKIVAKFSYNNESTNKTFDMTVATVREHFADADFWYNAKGGEAISVSGYVVNIATVYAEKYTNLSVYVVDDDFCHAFYLFQIKTTKEQADLMKPGVHITATSSIVSPYNGLIEGKGGNIVVDTDKDPIDIETSLYAIDNDIIGGVPATVYHTGALVSLTNWTVKSVAADSTSKSATLLTLEKGGKTVTVGYSNYMEGAYASADNNPSDELKAIKTQAKKFSQGSVVSVKGILSYYNGWQILPRSDADIVAGTADTAPTEGTKAKAAIDAVNAKLATENKGIFVANSTITLDTSKDGVTISYRVCGASDAVTISGGTITIKPTAVSETAFIEATYTIGNYKTTSYFQIKSQILSDAQIVELVKADVDSEVKKDFEKVEEVELPTTSNYPGVTISWSLKEAVAWASVANNKLSITSLPSVNSKATRVATIKLNSVTDTKEIEISVKAGDSNILAMFTFGDNGAAKHEDGTGITDGETKEIEKSGNYTLTLTNPSKVYTGAYDAYGNSCLKLGTSSAYASFSFTVADDVQYVKIYVAKYKTYSAGVKVNDGAVQALTKNSDNGEYDVIVVDVRTNKTVKFETAELTSDTFHNGRVMINTIEWCLSAD